MSPLRRGNHPAVRRLIALVTVGLLVPACGVPSEPKEQAAEVASIAAEGALLAGDAEAGRSTSAFVRTHSDALLERLQTLQPKIAEPELKPVAREVAKALDLLAENPSETGITARLEHAADRAEELAH
jgi:hypothetical protein